MKLGFCETCFGWTVGPQWEKCAYCIHKVAPLEPLTIIEVPQGSRIDVHAMRVFSPDGSIFFEHRLKNPESKDGPVAKIRQILHTYDEGMVTESSVAYQLFADEMDSLIRLAQESKEPRMWFTSSCGPTPPPADIVHVEVKRHGSDYTITPTDIHKLEAECEALKRRAEEAEGQADALVKATRNLQHSLGEYVRQSMHANPEWRSGLQETEDVVLTIEKARAAHVNRKV